MKIQHNKNPDPQGNWQDHLLVLWESSPGDELALDAFERITGRKVGVPLQTMTGNGERLHLYKGGWVIRWNDKGTAVLMVVSITISKEAWRPAILEAINRGADWMCSEPDEAPDEVLNVINQLLK